MNDLTVLALAVVVVSSLVTLYKVHELERFVKVDMLLIGTRLKKLERRVFHLTEDTDGGKTIE